MADTADFERDADGGLRLSGTLDFDGVAALWPRLRPHCAGAARIDLGAVNGADSAGLALLVACLREAARAGGAPRFVNVPAQLRDMARLGDLDGLLALDD